MDEPLAEATTSSKNDMPALDGIRHIRRRLTNTIDQSTDLPLPSNLAPTDLRLRSSDVDHLTTALITNTHEPASEFPSAGQSDRISDAENATMSDIDPLNIRSPEPSLSSSSPNPPDNAQSLQLDATMESPEPTTGVSCAHHLNLTITNVGAFHRAGYHRDPPHRTWIQI